MTPDELILEHLGRLVELDTTSDRSNLPLVEYVQECVRAHADEVRIVPNEEGDKAGVLVRFGPHRPGGIVLSGHTDCVPVTGQPWTGDPFELREVGDRLLGRGVTDMKGFIACCLAATNELGSAEPREPIWLAFSYDEELGARAAAPLADALIVAGATPRGVIVGEPTGMRIVNGHKGIWIGEVRIEGRAAHSSMPHEGVDALRAAMMLASHIAETAEAQRATVDDRFDPPYTTMNVGRLRAGTAVNIVPSQAEVLFEYRGIPGSDGPGIGQGILDFATQSLPARVGGPARLKVAAEQLAAAPALEPEAGGEAERIVRLAIGDDRPAATVAYATDGSAFQARGLSTVVCGPGRIEDAHQADESIERAQLTACAAMLRGLVDGLKDKKT